MIGASTISELAKKLEEAGGRRDIAVIQRDTEPFLHEFRGLREPLERIFRSGPEDGGSGLPPLPEEEFDEAVAAIRGFSAAFDDTSIQMVLEMLQTFSIPDSRQTQFRRLRDAFEQFDWERLCAACG